MKHTLSLDLIALQLLALAKEHGIATHTLRRGLELSVVWQADTGEYLLSLSRPNVEPSAKEIAIVRGAFGVPAGGKGEWWENFRYVVRWSDRPPVTTWVKPARNGNQWLWWCSQIGKQEEVSTP